MDLRFPIGKFQRPESATPEQRKEWIDTLASAPDRFQDAVRGLSDDQLDTPYRPDGWTVRQVCHHVADSHMNSFLRFRLALTEDEPTVKPYDEAKWALLADNSMPVEPSLCLLSCVHQRMVVMLRSLSDADFARKFIHPAMGPVELSTNLALYAWHSRHHEAHITRLRDRMGWK